MALFTTIAELRKYISVDVNAKFVTMQPFIEEAEMLFIRDLLGDDFYDEFSAAYAASVATEPVALSADNAKLLPYIQRCLAYYFQLQAIPHLSVTFGDMGIRQNRGEDSDVAPRYKEEKLQFQALKNGDLHADKLLEYLEKNASVSKYATWFASASNTINSGFIIYSTTVASKHISINNSRRIFLQLRNKMREIEQRFITKLISKDQYEELVTELKAGTLTDNNKLLIAKLEPIICKRALYHMLPVMRLSIQQDGLWLYSDTSLETRDRSYVADASAIEEYQDQLEGECDDDYSFGFRADEADLRQFILDNIDNYPLIKASGVYTVQPDPGPTWTTKTDINDKHFGV